jgi:hypothetical protein
MSLIHAGLSRVTEPGLLSDHRTAYQLLVKLTRAGQAFLVTSYEWGVHGKMSPSEIASAQAVYPTPWAWDLLRRQSVAQPLKNVPTFHDTRMFTRDLQKSLSKHTSIQSLLRSTLILFSRLRLYFRSDVFFWRPHRNPKSIPLLPMRATFPAYPSSLTWAL